MWAMLIINYWIDSSGSNHVKPYTWNHFKTERSCQRLVNNFKYNTASKNDMKNAIDRYFEVYPTNENVGDWKRQKTEFSCVEVAY